MLVITNITDLQLGDKLTVGIGVPFQLFWSILGWFAVCINICILLTSLLVTVKQGEKLLFFLLVPYSHVH